MGIELAPHHCLLMIRIAGQAWRGMSAAIIYFLPWSRRGAVQAWRSVGWRCNVSLGFLRNRAASWAPLAWGCAWRHSLALSELQTLWVATLYATLTFLSLHIQRSSGIWIWVMRRMHNPIAALHFISSHGWYIVPVIPKDYLVSTTALLFRAGT